jgi:hypothetical protein
MIKNAPRRWYFLGAVLVVLAAAFLATGRLGFFLAVVGGTLLGWALLDPDRALWAVLVVALAVPVTINVDYPVDPAHWVLVVVFFVAAWGRVMRSGLRRLSPAIILAAILPACSVLAGLVHWFGIKAILVGTSPLAAAALLCWYVIEEGRRDPRLVIRVARAFAWSSVPIAILAKVQTLTGTWPGFDQYAYAPEYTSAFDPTRAVGISGHPLIFGAFTMGTALVALTVRGRYWYVPFTASLVGLVLSGTRSAWIGMLIGLLIYLAYQKRRLTLRGLGSAAVIVAVTAIVVLGSPQLVAGRSFSSGGSATASRVTGSTASASGDAREVRIRLVWKGITTDATTVVFGHGPEAEVRYFKQNVIRDGQAQVFDNTYLSVWYDFGLVGLLSLVALGAGLFWRLRSVPARAIIAGTAVQIFFFDIWLWPSAIAVFAIGIGIGATRSPAVAARPLRELVGNRRPAGGPPPTVDSDTQSTLAPVGRADSAG